MQGSEVNTERLCIFPCLTRSRESDFEIHDRLIVACYHVDAFLFLRGIRTCSINQSIKCPSGLIVGADNFVRIDIKGFACEADILLPRQVWFEQILVVDRHLGIARFVKSGPVLGSYLEDALAPRVGIEIAAANGEMKIFALENVLPPVRGRLGIPSLFNAAISWGDRYLLNSVMSHLDPLSVINQIYVIKEIREAVPLKCVNWDQAFGGNCCCKSLEIARARVTGSVDGLERDSPRKAFLFKRLASPIVQDILPIATRSPERRRVRRHGRDLQHPAAEEHHGAWRLLGELLRPETEATIALDD